MQSTHETESAENELKHSLCQLLGLEELETYDMYLVAWQVQKFFNKVRGLRELHHSQTA